MRAEAPLRDELQGFRDELAAHKQEAEAARQVAEELKKTAEAELAQRLSAEQLAAKAREDAAIWETLAKDEIEAHRQAAHSEAQRSAALAEQNKKLLAELSALQAAAQAAPARQQAETLLQASQASEAIELDEAATRKLIDRQLRDAGWEVDSQSMTFERGVRPTRGKNMAISEWPTLADGKEGWADYVLFAGLQVLGVVEAKRKHKDVMGVIPQAKRLLRRLCRERRRGGSGRQPVGHDAGAVSLRHQRAPLLAPATHEERRVVPGRTPRAQPRNASRGLVSPRRPARPVEAKHRRRGCAPQGRAMPYIDRNYQKSAILAIEKGLEDGKRELLVAMATGTGKTRTCIGLCYRLLKTKRCRRVLFLVDRSALGKQTADALKDLRLENLQTFTDIFDVKELGDLKPDSETKLHIATIQAMVKRVIGPFEGSSEADIPSVGQYDCIIVDECHRGYLLDRELSEREFLFRDEDDYISKYRRVLDHFDAIKIGLTATPALHTKEVFGSPIYSYSYREAVIDGFLVDHEPPIRIVTKLAQDGIHYQAREEVLVLDRSTQTVKKEELADEIQFDVDAFNRRVITEPFNRAVIGEVVKHIDPEQDEKTLVFCPTDEHADMVVLHFKEALNQKYGSVDDDAVAKITGATDRPLEAITRYRNERNPNIAVTVDLLTTGIDVPKIANLVFLRRVRSRILYEQMIGRATRLCPDIGKERFRIFDAVDLYSALKDVTDMKPVVVNPLVSFEQLVKEVVEGKEEEFRRAALDEFLAKLQRKKRALKDDAAERFAVAADMDVKELAQFLKKASVGDAAEYLTQHPALAGFLDRTTGGGTYKMVISERVDEVREVSHGYGKHGNRRPSDFLESFRSFVENNLNTLPALLVVQQRPRDLTREDLRKLKLALDQEGYSEKSVQSAWRDQRNEDIAATIVGYIRQLALGAPLLPYAERVDHAVQRLRKTHHFTDPQSKWLDRIAKQVKLETVVDPTSLDSGQFKTGGGFARLNKVFDGKLESILGELAEEVWKDAS